MYHVPVLLDASIQGLNIQAGGIYVDATYGGGGHSSEILKELDTGRLFGFDQDPDARQNIIDDPKLIFLNENFRFMKNFLKLYKVNQVDGILADLGISSWQIDQPERGFSTRFQGPLDMRMDKKNPNSAASVLNNYDHRELARVFRLYGELKNAGRIAAEIVFQRQSNPIETTDQLKKMLEKFAPRGKENKFHAQVFQALRIEVNNELDVLRELIEQSASLLRQGGRLVIISYHSLEDRLVKNYFRSGSFTGEVETDFFGNVIAPFKPVGKMIPADDMEQAANPRSRSARLRIAEKTDIPWPKTQ